MSKQTRRTAQRRRQNNQRWIWGVVALFLLGLSLVWFGFQGGAEPGGFPKEVSVEEAAAMRDAGAFVLDVRLPEEWNEYHVPGSTLIPLGELATRLEELPGDQDIVVVCRSGNRSAQARDILLDAGFTQVTSLDGGLTQWKAAGYETVSGP